MRSQSFATAGRCVVALVGLSLLTALAQTPAKPQSAPSVHLVWMGGNDCPPCVNWRLFEKPKLDKSPYFQSIQFSYVIKVIRSPVPPRFFLPEDVKMYKERLDAASGGMTGSPQAALLVNGEVYDYFWGTRTAEEIEQMLVSVRTGSAYPFQRCVKRTQNKSCASPG